MEFGLKCVEMLSEKGYNLNFKIPFMGRNFRQGGKTTWMIDLILKYNCYLFNLTE